MKKLELLCLLLFISQITFAQLKVQGKAIIGGTTLPVIDRFQVNGDMRLEEESPFLRFKPTSTGAAGLNWKNSSNANIGSFWLDQANNRIYLDVNGFVSNGAEFTFDTNGDMGIGTLDPLAPLHISRPVSELARFESTAASKWIAFYQSGVRKGILWNAGNNMVLRADAANSNIQFQTAASTRMIIENDGDLLARTSTRRATFTLAHPTGSGANTGFTLFNDGGGGNYWNLYTVNSSGDFEIFQNGAFKGRFLASNGSYTPASDRKYKSNIKSMDKLLERIQALRPRTYTMKHDRSGKEHLGFIAQEVEEVFPQLVYLGPVGDTEEQAYTMDYGGMAVVAIKGIQELSGKEELLEAKQEELQEEVSVLRIENENLRQNLRDMAKEMRDLKAMLSDVVQLQENCCRFHEQIEVLELPVKDTPISLDLRAELRQNVPNPFQKETKISYFIPENTIQAYITITDPRGLLLKQITIEGSGEGEILLDVQHLPAGTYAYSLFVDGRQVDTRQMILGKL